MTLPAPLTGVVPPVCTPLTPDREVDVPSLVGLVDHLVAGGVNGLFVLGTSSEAAFLTDARRRLVVETVAGHVGGRLPVLAGVIDMTTARVLDHVRAVTAAGADAVVVTAPFYASTHPVEIARHYRLVAAGSPVPVIAYDLPSGVHTKLPADVVLDLAAEGVLAGLKDSSGDLAGFRTVVSGARARADITGFSALTGSELFVDAALAVGADGAVPRSGQRRPRGIRPSRPPVPRGRPGGGPRRTGAAVRPVRHGGRGRPGPHGRIVVGARRLQGGAVPAGRDRLPGDGGAAGAAVGGGGGAGGRIPGRGRAALSSTGSPESPSPTRRPR